MERTIKTGFCFRSVSRQAFQGDGIVCTVCVYDQLTKASYVPYVSLCIIRIFVLNALLLDYNASLLLKHLNRPFQAKVVKCSFSNPAFKAAVNHWCSYRLRKAASQVFYQYNYIKAPATADERGFDTFFLPIAIPQKRSQIPKNHGVCQHTDSWSFG